MQKPLLSIIIPVYNEEDNILPLWNELKETLTELPPAEVIFVDDGSRDKSREILRGIAEKDIRIKVIFFQKNSGQTAALGAGVHYAKGEVIVPMDSDLENDPADIKRLLKKMDEGFDVVSGWRRKRWANQRFVRKIPSVIASLMISKITGVPLHDHGCTIKAYKSDIIKQIDFLGEIHRFISVYASWYGATVVEIEVNHRPRIHGVSKYGFGRVPKVVLDLLVAKFMMKYSTKPIHFFGMLGFFSFLFGGLSFLLATFLRFYAHVSYIQTPLLLLTALLFMAGLQFISIGLIADMILRTRGSGYQTYRIKEVINGEVDTVSK